MTQGWARRSYAASAVRSSLSSFLRLPPARIWGPAAPAASRRAHSHGWHPTRLGFTATAPGSKGRRAVQTHGWHPRQVQIRPSQIQVRETSKLLTPAAWQTPSQGPTSRRPSAALWGPCRQVGSGGNGGGGGSLRIWA